MLTPLPPTILMLCRLHFILTNNPANLARRNVRLFRFRVDSDQDDKAIIHPLIADIPLAARPALPGLDRDKGVEPWSLLPPVRVLG